MKTIPFPTGELENLEDWHLAMLDVLQNSHTAAVDQATRSHATTPRYSAGKSSPGNTPLPSVLRAPCREECHSLCMAQ